MQTINRRLESITVYLTASSAIAVLFSIAISQILLGLALISLLVSRRPLLFPPRLRYPLAAFIGWTLLSLAFSDAPLSGLSKVRKLFLFLILLLVYSAYRNRREVLRTFQGAILAGGIAGLLGLVQFSREYLKIEQQSLPFYKNYITHQISGFMGHWMTFGGELMLVVVLVVSLMLFLRPGEMSGWWWLLLVPMSAALLLSFTRGIWLATLAGIAYLLARTKRPALCLGLPALILLLFLLAPQWLKQREQSIFDTRTDSSNRARIVMLHTGLAMIAKHPWFGVGLERIGPEFMLYKPASLGLPTAWYGHLHNNYIQIAAERGIPCLLILLWLFIEVFREGLTCGGSSLADTRTMGHITVAATVALMVGGLFEYNFGDSEVLMLYLFVIGATSAWARIERSETAP